MLKHALMDQRGNGSSFMTSTKTQDAILQLAAADRMVVYCGAGVSIDRTGVSWRQLIRELFEQLSNSSGPGFPKAVVSRLIGELGNEESASVAVEMAGKLLNARDGQISKELQALIYRRHGWSQGLLLVNLAGYCLTAAILGKEITIVTTNYDTHVEKKIAEAIADYTTQLRKDLDKASFKALRIPGIGFVGYEAQKNGTPPHRGTLLEPRGGAGSITIHYPHGRLPEDGGESSRSLVLTEASYAASHAQTTAILSECLQRVDDSDPAMLIVGASVSDRPLIEVLASRKLGSAYALLRVESWLGSALFASFAPSERRTLGDALDSRGRNIGVSFLKPDEFWEVAQFFEELRLQHELNSFASGNRLSESPLAYAKRFESWKDDWNAARDSGSAEKDYEVLDGGLKLIREDFDGLSDEELRIEIWVAEALADSGPSIRLLANTSGPLKNSHVERRASLLERTSASVACFNAGRPLMKLITDLSLPKDASRWKTFFSVPIFRESLSEFFGEKYSAHMALGVVTLASTTPDSELWSMSSEQKDNLIDVMVEVGGLILGGPAIRPPGKVS